MGSRDEDEKKNNMREKERHQIKETDTLPCHQPMFLYVCSVEGKGQQVRENENTAVSLCKGEPITTCNK